MGTTIHVKFPRQGSAERINNILFGPNSGIELLDVTGSQFQDTLKSEVGTWIELGALVVAAIPAAKSLYELIQLVRSPSKSESQKGDVANAVTISQVTITINQINYEVTNSGVEELWRLLEDS